MIPLDMVHECIELKSAIIDSNNYITLREELLPLIHLSELFECEVSPSEHETSEQKKNIIVVQFAGMKAGLIVDQLLGEFQTVIKPLSKVFQHLRGFSGATILGSGDVALIIDVAAVIQKATHTNENNVYKQSGLKGSPPINDQM